MAKIFLFIFLTISSRHLQVSLDKGVHVFLVKSRVHLQENLKESPCKVNLYKNLDLFKSFYCFNKNNNNVKKKRTLQIIFTTSKKKKPPLIKDGLQIFIPFQKWEEFFFIK